MSPESRLTDKSPSPKETSGATTADSRSQGELDSQMGGHQPSQSEATRATKPGPYSTGFRPTTSSASSSGSQDMDTRSRLTIYASDASYTWKVKVVEGENTAADISQLWGHRAVFGRPTVRALCACPEPQIMMSVSDTGVGEAKDRPFGGGWIVRVEIWYWYDMD